MLSDVCSAPKLLISCHCTLVQTCVYSFEDASKKYSCMYKLLQQIPDSLLLGTVGRPDCHEHLLWSEWWRTDSPHNPDLVASFVAPVLHAHCAVSPTSGVGMWCPSASPWCMVVCEGLQQSMMNIINIFCDLRNTSRVTWVIIILIPWISQEKNSLVLNNYCCRDITHNIILYKKYIWIKKS